MGVFPQHIGGIDGDAFRFAKVRSEHLRCRLALGLLALDDAAQAAQVRKIKWREAVPAHEGITPTTLRFHDASG
jgi:hypothetical protein